MSAQPIMERRRRATQATMDRFLNAPFAWGKNDCARMCAFHLRKLGYPLRLAKAGSYSTALGGKRAMKRLGFATLAEAADAYGLERIAPAATLIGDLIEMPGEGFGAMVVAVGNGRALGWHEDAEGAVVMQPSQFLGAWRTVPL